MRILDLFLTLFASVRCMLSTQLQGRGQMLTNGGPSALNKAMMQQLLHALQYLHDGSVVHRDIRPHNVLLTEGLQAKLSDMGLSRRLDSNQSSFHSRGPGQS